MIYKIIPDRNTLLTQLQTGEVDMWTFVPAAFVGRATALANLNHVRGPSYLYTHIDFNTSHPALKDVVVRQALRLATDRRTILEKVSHGVGILQEGAITPASLLHVDLPEVPYDVAQANKLLDDAGWARGSDGVRAKNGVRLDLDVATVAGNQDVDARIEQLRSEWQMIGVKITPKHYNSALFFQVTGGILYGGKWDVTTFAWQMTPDADLNPENSCDLLPPNGQNVTRLCDRQRLEPLLQQQKVTYSEEARKPIVAQAEKIIDEDVPYEVLYINEDVHAFNADLTNWHPNNTTPFDDFLNVDI